MLFKLSCIFFSTQYTRNKDYTRFFDIIEWKTQCKNVFGIFTTNLCSKFHYYFYYFWRIREIYNVEAVILRSNVILTKKGIMIPILCWSSKFMKINGYIIVSNYCRGNRRLLGILKKNECECYWRVYFGSPCWIPSVFS